ncbi:hypothetical protein NEAUS04_1836 [Nematocida ausubeli]|uniref:Uncharacterized protein n=1 Tax=Nematocida ausubeli (strain ATCC PRA-371 / ERTm2) TaxID=1913371 RepID=A0A086J0R4_NEMA1|nr:uncharacterized protein NESG_01716 [Nematocida ausubeli]KAI5136699.1 hypothetical protein NEAUS06_1960 [Nematocida ausubeli]KAI5137164.1 hypothetical protein NEAUS07_1857 [Nematocida ausubeli]KAI5149752.1 hypothetical protein NEAUS05_1889 [Nematocida ausubeli]KAI5163950.1 hypothetical protein NEAUS04_1836 [Nematocida ausubeli]KFG25732.1 hypothetical protein NESG_01716 [Nematocida ausubeli]
MIFNLNITINTCKNSIAPSSYMAKNNFSKKNLLYILFIVSSMHSFQIACTPWHKKFFSLLKPTKYKPSSGSGMQVNNDSEKVNTNSNSPTPPPHIELNTNSNPSALVPQKDLNANSNLEVSKESSIQTPQDPSLKDSSVFLKKMDEILEPLFNISKEKNTKETPTLTFRKKFNTKEPPTPTPRKKFNTKETPIPIPRKDLDADGNPPTPVPQKDDDADGNPSTPVPQKDLNADGKATILKEISDLFDACCADFDLNTEETPTTTPHKDLDANNNFEVSNKSSTQAPQDPSLRDSSEILKEKKPNKNPPTRIPRRKFNTEKTPTPIPRKDLDANSNFEVSKKSSIQAPQDSSLKDSSKKVNQKAKAPAPPRPKNLDIDNPSVISNNSSTPLSHNLPNKPPIPPRPKNLNRDNTSVISKK